MPYWLLKSEPHAYSWEMLVKEKSTLWTGVRNHTAKQYLASMKIGDQALFYHSNEGKACVGIAQIIAEAIPDPTTTADKLNKDGTNPWLAPTVAPVKALPHPVTLTQVKATPALQNMALLRYSRLSVQPVTPTEWQVILKLAKTSAN